MFNTLEELESEQFPNIPVNFEVNNGSSHFGNPEISVVNVLTVVLQNNVYKIITLETKTTKKSSFNSHVYCTRMLKGTIEYLKFKELYTTLVCRFH